MVQIQKLTAQTLLGASRRGPAVPNASGTLALYSHSVHDFDKNKTTKEVRVIDIRTGHSVTISNDEKVHDVLWIPDVKQKDQEADIDTDTDTDSNHHHQPDVDSHTSNDIVFLKSGDKGRTQVVIANGADHTKDHYIAAELDAPISALKLKALDDGSVAFVVAGLVSKHGSLLNDQAVEKKTSARIFDSARVRVWNELFSSHRYSLWYSKLERQDDGKWKLAGELNNLIQKPDLEAPLGMYDVEDATGNFDISHQGIAFLGLNALERTPDQVIFCSPYYVPLECFSQPPTSDPLSIDLQMGSKVGMGANIRFSPDGSVLAFIHADGKDLQNARIYTANVESLEAFDVLGLMADPSDMEGDYFPPEGFEFAGSSDALILQSARCGRTALAHLKLLDGAKPTIFYQEGSVSAYLPLVQGQWDRLLVSSSSYIDSSVWKVVKVSDDPDLSTESHVLWTISSATKNGLKYGLSPKMINEFWFEGADDLCVHSFMIRPSNFDENKTYPWVLMPHGGPVSSWSDSWSTRWNMAAWAEQGYVIICPNISGSTGYGMEFSKRVNGQWGGNPFQDLLNLIKYLEKLPYLDQDKAVLAGASYGGYMVSWFFGHEIINKFCCAVWHDGIFNIPSFSLQSDILVDDGEYGKSPYPWKNPEGMDQWNPARPDLLRNWKNAPPTIIIHSEKDYRCPITEGLACFHALQAQGVPSRFLTFSDECHWVLSPENSLAWHETVWDWVSRCVNGEIVRGDAEW